MFMGSLYPVVFMFFWATFVFMVVVWVTLFMYIAFQIVAVGFQMSRKNICGVPG